MGLPGTATYAGGAFGVDASGTDIEETSDQFHYVYQVLTGDGAIQARVAAIENTDPWAKGGVMIRETLAADSKHAMMALTPANGLVFQRRPTTGGTTDSTLGAAVSAPYWVRVVRTGSTLAGYSSPDGATWTLVGSTTISMSSSVLAGMPLTSHNNSLLCSATLDNVLFSPTITPTPSHTPTQTLTFTPSQTPTQTPTQTRTSSPTASRTATATNTASATPTNTPTATRTGSATATPTRTNTPTVTPAAPTVSSIAPTSGPAAAGNAVSVGGSSFQPGATLKIGGAAATTVVVVNGGQITGKTPGLSAGTLNDVTVTNPGNLSSTLTKGWFADFSDVPQANPFHGDIETVFRDGITGGCGAGQYCPTNLVTRAQMAVFLLKGMHGGAYAPPACSTTVFADVPCPGGPFVDWVNQLSAEGITSGCGGGNYCPNSSLTRAQMAVFLLRGEHGSAYAPPACSATVFADVPCPGGANVNWINQLASEGVTAGCGNGNYCPAAATPRQQMATFLVRTFGLTSLAGRTPVTRPADLRPGVRRP